LKDRLYAELPDSRLRRSAQTVLYEVLTGLVRLMSPILSFTAAETWPLVPLTQGQRENIFLTLFPQENDEYLQNELYDNWQRLQQVRGEITRALELARREKVIGHSLEAEVWVQVKDAELQDFLANKWEILTEIAIVSALHPSQEELVSGVVSEDVPGLTVLVKSARGGKCERCWTRSESVGRSSKHPTICSRCEAVVEKL